MDKNINSLKGRYVKALQNCPFSISDWNKGEYRQITNDEGINIQGNYIINLDMTDRIQLMSEGFDLATGIEYYCRKWPSKTLTMGCNEDGYFKALEEYNYEGGVRAGDKYGSLTGGSYPQFSATPEQIAYFKIHGTLTTYNTNKVVTEYEIY